MHVAHCCYIQPIVEAPPKQQDDSFDDLMNFNDDDDNDEDKRGPPPPPVLNFADIECAISEDRLFQPNLTCWSSEEDEKIHHERTTEEFLEDCEAPMNDPDRFHWGTMVRKSEVNGNGPKSSEKFGSRKSSEHKGRTFELLLYTSQT